MADVRLTYLLVDGENIDMTLGGILGRRPEPDQRPRWARLVHFVEATWAQPVKGLFFINASSGVLPLPFVQALLALGYRPIPLAGQPGEKVVDIGIQRTLEALVGRVGDVVLASHDGDFVDQMAALSTNDRRVGLVGFAELVSQRLREVDGIEIFDLETDAHAFDAALPRVTIIALDDFDPVNFL